MEAILTNITAAAGPLGDVIYLLVVTALIDTGSGIWAAARSGSLDISFLDTFVKSHVFEKWGPILGTLVGGVAIGGTDSPVGMALVAAGVAQIAAYEAATVSSVFGIGSKSDGNLKTGTNKTKGLPSSVVPPTT